MVSTIKLTVKYNGDDSDRIDQYIFVFEIALQPALVADWKGVSHYGWRLNDLNHPWQV